MDTITPEQLREFSRLHAETENGIREDGEVLAGIGQRLLAPTFNGIAEDKAALQDIGVRLVDTVQPGIKADAKRLNRIKQKLATPTFEGIQQDRTVLTGIAARAQHTTFPVPFMGPPDTVGNPDPPPMVSPGTCAYIPAANAYSLFGGMGDVSAAPVSSPGGNGSVLGSSGNSGLPDLGVTQGPIFQTPCPTVLLGFTQTPGVLDPPPGPIVPVQSGSNCPQGAYLVGATGNDGSQLLFCVPLGQTAYPFYGPDPACAGVSLPSANTPTLPSSSPPPLSPPPFSPPPPPPIAISPPPPPPPPPPPLPPGCDPCTAYAVGAITQALASGFATAFGSADAHTFAAITANAYATATGGNAVVNVAPTLPSAAPANLCQCIMQAAAMICDCILRVGGMATAATGQPGKALPTLDLPDWQDPDDWWTDPDDTDNTDERANHRPPNLADFVGSAGAGSSVGLNPAVPPAGPALFGD